MEIFEYIDKLTEDSYTERDVPDYFYLAFGKISDGIKEEAEALKRGYFEGLKGISGSNEIVIEFMPYLRDMALKMDGYRVLKENDLTRVMYDNPHYLVSKDMKAMRRVLNISPERENVSVIDRKKIVESIFQKLFDDYPSLSPSSPISKLVLHMKYDRDEIFEEIASRPIDTIDEFSEQWVNAVGKDILDDYGVNKDDLMDLLKDLVVNSVEEFSDEVEWMVKDDKFYIPKGSTIMISWSKMSDEMEDRYQSFRNDVEEIGLKKASRSVEPSRWARSFEQRYRVERAIEEYSLDQKYVIRYVNKSKIRAIAFSIAS